MENTTIRPTAEKPVVVGYMKMIIYAAVGMVTMQQAVSAIGPTIVDFVEEEFHFQEWMGAFVYSFGVLGTILMAPIAGVLSDYWGRRRCILYGGLITGIFIIILSLAPSVYWLFPPMFIKSIGFAMVTTSVLGYITDVTPHKDRGKGMGIFGISMTLGAIIGVSLGTYITDEWSGRLAYVVCAIIAIVGAIVAYGITQESGGKDAKGSQMAVNWENIKRAFGISEKASFLKRNKLLTIFIMIGLLNSLAWGVCLILSSELVEDVLGHSLKVAGLGIILASVIMLLGSYPAGQWVDKSGVKTPYLLALGINILGLIFIAGAVNVPMYLIGWAAVGIAHTLFNPAANVFIARLCPPHERGLAFGLVFTGATMGIFIGPLVTAPFISFFSARFPFIACLVTSLIATALFLKYIKSSFE